MIIFIITNIEYIDTKKYDELGWHIHLDEKMHAALQGDIHFESKGFIAPVEVTDFPIRDHKVVQVLRRRRWVEAVQAKASSCL